MVCYFSQIRSGFGLVLLTMSPKVGPMFISALKCLNCFSEKLACPNGHALAVELDVGGLGGIDSSADHSDGLRFGGRGRFGS